MSLNPSPHTPSPAPATAVAPNGPRSLDPATGRTDSPADTVTVALHQWRDAGWLRRLDVALADFIAELDPAASPALRLASAVLAHLEGQGHTCLLLDDFRQRGAELLGWPAPARQALAAILPAGLPADSDGWWQALAASPTVRCAAEQADHGQPLVLVRDADGDRLYLRRYWQHECGLAEQLLARSEAGTDAPPLNRPLARQWLDRLFPADARRPAPGVDWQKLACAVALRGRLCVITGGPGTGKTYTAARLLALSLAVSPQAASLRIALAAPTGKAAARLKQAIDAALRQLPAAGAADAPDFAALTQRIGPARTLHALLGARPDSRQWRHHAGQPLDVDLLIVDEASMIHLEMMAALLEALPPTARLVLLGDKDQLASVEAGAVLGDLCRDAQHPQWDAGTVADAEALAGISLAPSPAAAAPAERPPGLQALARQTVMLRESHRFGGPIGQLAQAVNRGDAVTASALLAAGTDQVLRAELSATPDAVLALALHGREGAAGSYRAYLQLMADGPAPLAAGAQPMAQEAVPATERPVWVDPDGEPLPAGGLNAAERQHRAWVQQVLQAFDRCRILTALREGDWGAAGLNRAIARALGQQGWIAPQGEWYAGRPVMVTRNDAALGVFNGDIGITLPAADGRGLKVWFTDGAGEPRAVSTSRLAQVETAFAMTVHKSQGSEFEHTVLVLPPGAGALLSRELVYTGITRARQAFTLVSANVESLPTAIGQPTRRASGLLARLDSSSARSGR